MPLDVRLLELAAAVEEASRRGLRLPPGLVAGAFTDYQGDPERFSLEALGVRWWAKQAEMARLLVAGNTAVEAGNAVGKSFAAASLALYWLSVHDDAKVITTAPTGAQVREILWREIRTQYAGARISLPGEMMKTRLDISEDWFGIGLTPQDVESFQGFHAEYLLVILDEASGVPPERWSAVRTLATGRENRILAIGNPTKTSGDFHDACHKDPGWSVLRISCLEHPNVVGGTVIPGAVSREWVEEQMGLECRPGDGPSSFEWEGKRRVPSAWFEAHVLGRPPTEDEGSVLIPGSWLERAVELGKGGNGPDG